MRELVDAIGSEYRRYKRLADGAMEQVDEAALNRASAGFDNSIAVLVWHLSGNLASRFTEFLTSDGEKPWRARDEEFQPRQVSRSELLKTWEDGWRALTSALDGLTDEHLSRTVTIRGEPHSVHQALQRSLAHFAYHVGQIVYIAKEASGRDWKFMSIPPGKSAEFNRGMRTKADGREAMGER